MNKKGYVCITCGKYHDELPMDWAFRAPDYWNDTFAEKDPKKNFLTSDTCVIDNESFFIRGVIEIPIISSDTMFDWGVWVSLSEDNFQRYCDVYGTEAELKEKSYFGWLANQLPGYPDTLKIKTNVHLQGDKLRPKIELDHSDSHQLCQEQHNGITMHRVNEIINSAS